MHELAFVFAGFFVGVIVGLTGVGGGSLMTPILIFFFGVKPYLAVGTDLLFAAFTKMGGTIKLARGDRLLANEPVGFLKIDVEGMELGVLSGLEQTIRRNRPRMFVEVENKNIPSFLAWAEARDYKVAKTFRRYRTNENFLLVSAI